MLGIKASPSDRSDATTAEGRGPRPSHATIDEIATSPVPIGSLNANNLPNEDNSPTQHTTSKPLPSKHQ